MKRMFFKTKREKKENMELDITSLLDVLVILLVFLLKSYNASDLKLNLVKNLEVPDSKTRKLGNHSIIVQVDQNQNIWVNNEKIGSVTNSAKNTHLFEKLQKLKDEEDLKRVPASIDSQKKTKQKMINLVFDKKLKYQYIKGIMHTSALAGFSKFKFIVKGNYN